MVGEKDSFAKNTENLIQEESTKAAENLPNICSLSDLKLSEDNQSCSRFGMISNDVSWDDHKNESLQSKLDSPKVLNTNEQFSDDIDELSERSYEVMRSSKARKQQVRWRKEDDRILFPSLVDVLQSQGMTINEFCCFSMKEYKPPMLMELIEKTGWKGSVTSFIQRIMKLYNSSKKLSCREMKRLRKFYYNQIRA
mmetsp:Transcript_28102/g.32200  ORF Transcript_28102/g.32200 Transcript_28102/m.32200 type:complete len:196 (+) Transcript_28102:249-836(+)